MGKWQWVAALFGVALLVMLTWLGYGYYLRREVRSVIEDVRTLSIVPDHTGDKVVKQ